jgi:NADH-quinone oxidoreductase subunit C
MTDPAPPDEDEAEAEDEVVVEPAPEPDDDSHLPDDPVLAGLAEAFDGAVFDAFEPAVGPRQDVVAVDRGDVVPFVTAARDAGFETFIDICAVDHFTREPRFDVVINLLSMRLAKRLRVVVGLPNDDPVMPSLTGVYAGANFYEREAWDLMGVRFTGHPDLTRLLLPDEWVGHPLRKDQGVGSVPVQFKGANQAT